VLTEAKGLDLLEVVMDTMAEGTPLLVLFGHYAGDLEDQRTAIEASKKSGRRNA
jgi:glycogen synthase